MNAMYGVNPWIKIHQLKPKAKLRLFCFPYAGGGSVVFHAWHKSLPLEVEVCTIQLPGREDRLMDPPIGDMAELMPLLEHAVKPFLDKPFACFGHSVGALIAFELVRKLRPRAVPVHFFASGRQAPQEIDSRPPLHHLPDAAIVEGLQHRYQGIPQAVLEHKELMELILPAIRADLSLAETYAYTEAPPLDCPITAYGGRQDRNVSYDRLTTWKSQTTRTFSLETFPGDHFYMNQNPAPLFKSISDILLRYIA